MLAMTLELGMTSPGDSTIHYSVKLRSNGTQITTVNETLRAVKI